MGRDRSSRADPAAAFARLRVWERAGVRAPHKPLLVLYALGRWANGEHAVRFADAAEPLRALLAEFGPPRRSHHPEYPFWYLKTDGVWDVAADGPLAHRAGKSQPAASELVRMHAVGAFAPAVQAALSADPALVGRIARDLLDAHFPASIHPDILAAVGLDPESATAVQRRPRDPRFREAVLTAYGYRCAVCGLGLRLGPQAALDAAHIRWHAAGGPDAVANGLCLCVLHHKLFDLGAFTVEATTGAVRVSDRVNGDGADRVLLAHEGQPVGRPRRADWHPTDASLDWHRTQVFHHS